MLRLLKHEVFNYFANMGYPGFLAFTILYPLSLGWLFSWLGFSRFKKGDLV